MKSFIEHAKEQEQLEEGILRSGAIASIGAKSRQEGDEAVRAYRQGKQALRRGQADPSVDDRLLHIEIAISALLDGLIKQREQIGSGVALDVVGHTLSAKGR